MSKHRERIIKELQASLDMTPEYVQLHRGIACQRLGISDWIMEDCILLSEENKMDFNTYQNECKKTAIYPEQNTLAGLLYTTLGLCGEAGEVGNRTKKVLRDDGGQIRDDYRSAMRDELGDVLWYVAMMANELHLSMDDIAIANTAKLLRRKSVGMIQGSGDR